MSFHQYHMTRQVTFLHTELQPKRHMLKHKAELKALGDEAEDMIITVFILIKRNFVRFSGKVVNRYIKYTSNPCLDTLHIMSCTPRIMNSEQPVFLMSSNISQFWGIRKGNPYLHDASGFPLNICWKQFLCCIICITGFLR